MQWRCVCVRPLARYFICLLASKHLCCVTTDGVRQPNKYGTIIEKNGCPFLNQYKYFFEGKKT